MDLNTYYNYYLTSMLSGLSGTSSASSLLSGNTTSLSSASTLSFLNILQSLQNLRNADSVNSVNNASIIGSVGAGTNAGSASSLSAGTSMDAIFEKAADRYGVDVDLLKAIGKAESNFNASAISSAGAIGVMQLMPSTARSLGVTNAYDAEQNIMGGAKYISQMLDRYDGDVELALAAYNAGPGNVDKYGGIPPFKETQNYVNRVLDYMGEDLSTGKTALFATQNGSGGIDAATSDSAGSSGTIEIKTETLLTMLELMQAQMQLQMLSGMSSWDSSSSL